MIEIVLPGIIIPIMLYGVLIGVLGFALSWILCAIGYLGKYAFIIGYSMAVAFVLACSIVSSVFAGDPFPIQMINISVGAP